MKVALFERPHHLIVTKKPLRSLDNDEVLIDVTACGVCGTDLHIVEGSSRSSPPVVLGHEYAGIIQDLGKEVRGFSVGDHVAIDPNIACGTCFFCRRGEVHLCENLRALGVDIDGGMSESNIAPATQLYRLPKTLTTEKAAFVEPLSCAVHGIDRAGIKAGDTVVILGGGTVGLLLTQLSRISGAARVIVAEPVAWKREIASASGADVVIDPVATNIAEAVRDLTHVGADVVVECAGKTETTQLAFELTRRGGIVVLFGVCPVGVKVPMEPNSVYFKELTIVGSYVNPHTFDRAIALLVEKKVNIDQFVIQKYPLDGVQEALNSLREGKTIKSMIMPTL
ncbi:MAG TPA: zinc-dependent alcohol dehydrogenase family protein [Bacteroidota bacterium]